MDFEENRGPKPFSRTPLRAQGISPWEASSQTTQACMLEWSRVLQDPKVYYQDFVQVVVVTFIATRLAYLSY